MRVGSMIDSNDRLAVHDSVDTSSAVELTSGVILRQRFDVSAAVLLGPGADGAPGQAGMDDDFDGVVDNAGELGAVGSDDRCLAPWNVDYQAVAQQTGAITISRGAFVNAPENPSDIQHSPASLVPGQRQGVRFLIIGQTNSSVDQAASDVKTGGSNETGRYWSRLIVDQRLD